MSRKPIIAGNWKLNKNLKEVKEFIANIDGKLPSEDKVEVAIAAPALYLVPMVQERGNNPLKVAAENVYFENSGAFTGEIAPAMLAAEGIEYSVIGHSERREYFHETDEDINKKAKALIAAGVTPILCCGETLETFEAGKTAEWVSAQIEAGLAGIDGKDVANMVIAYEPIWAIGTGKTATAEIADETCGVVRSTVEKLYGKEVSDAVRIQYGGSVKPETVAELMSKENIDGALVGGASLEADSFLGLLEIYK
ncbi:triose-phosphate isomerase [Lactococcus garvieae]|uniref:Triosephosphate isomerase n=1 Tax=Lactococcus garvieae TaxID=1363 RepID=A0AA46YU07_9LACT|nr:triose-phosphate isomerase [Lactococcus garvieae]UYT11174.1 triose-phosphate isomerase [Lactococcus garvieae]UYT11762.1 triose-phosphate isomerase [Lactococcus garvieae]